jgi:leader peptidase (prepilin peptidase)/N-methyltransferase
MNAIEAIWPSWLPPTILAPVILAPAIGSFLGVLIERLPEGRPVVFARSACGRCGQRLRARDMVPLLSYAMSLGRCRYCAGRIGAFPPAIELAALAVAIWAVAASGETEIWATCGLGWTLLALGWIDARTMTLPDVLTLPLLAMGLIVTGLRDLNALASHAMAAGLGYCSLVGVAWLYFRLRGRDGLGRGDAKLLAAAGAWLGPALLPHTVFLAACAGLFYVGGAWLAGRRMTGATALPFGPCLALAIWLLWLYADDVEYWLSAT